MWLGRLAQDRRQDVRRRSEHVAEDEWCCKGGVAAIQSVYNKSQGQTS